MNCFSCAAPIGPDNWNLCCEMCSKEICEKCTEDREFGHCCQSCAAFRRCCSCGEKILGHGFCECCSAEIIAEVGK